MQEVAFVQTQGRGSGQITQRDREEMLASTRKIHVRKQNIWALQE